MLSFFRIATYSLTLTNQKRGEKGEKTGKNYQNLMGGKGGRKKASLIMRHSSSPPDI